MIYFSCASNGFWMQMSIRYCCLCGVPIIFIPSSSGISSSRRSWRVSARCTSSVYNGFSDYCGRPNLFLFDGRTSCRLPLVLYKLFLNIPCKRRRQYNDPNKIYLNNNYWCWPVSCDWEFTLDSGPNSCELRNKGIFKNNLYNTSGSLQEVLPSNKNRFGRPQ
jgi:hypothetical protein